MKKKFWLLLVCFSPMFAFASGGVDVGVPGYPDSLVFQCPVGGSYECPDPFISTTTPWTILSVSVAKVGGSSASYLYCGEDLLPLDFPSVMWGNYSTLGIQTVNAPIHCSASLNIGGTQSFDYVFVQYVPYDTRVPVFTKATTTMASTTLDYLNGDIQYVLYWILFFTALTGIGSAYHAFHV